MRKRLHFVHGPTPIERFDGHGALALEDVDLWIKRDDMTGGAAAGNKIRKLELFFAHALERESNHVITCGGLQSNHARATAIVAARLGMRATLVLRTDDPKQDLPAVGNVLLDRLVGAEIRLITPAEYAEREAYMASVANEISALGGKPYIIPEGGSDGLARPGYFGTRRQVREQVVAGLA